MACLHTLFLTLPYAALAAGAAALGLKALGAPDRRLRQGLFAALTAMVALHGVIFLHTALAYIAFPYEQKSVVEGVTVYNALQYTKGEQPYRDPTKAPFRSTVYPPVHELALAGVMAVLGGPSLAGGRLLSLLCVLGTVFVAGLAVWRHTRNWPLTILGGGFFICGYGLSLQWLEQVRNDALLVFLIVLGLYLAERAMAKKRLPAAALAVLVLALYTKQTALFAIAAVGLVLFARNRRQAFVWGGELRARRRGHLPLDAPVERGLVLVLPRACPGGGRHRMGPGGTRPHLFLGDGPGGHGGVCLSARASSQTE